MYTCFSTFPTEMTRIAFVAVSISVICQRSRSRALHCLLSLQSRQGIRHIIIFKSVVQDICGPQCTFILCQRVLLSSLPKSKFVYERVALFASYTLKDAYHFIFCLNISIIYYIFC